MSQQQITAFLGQGWWDAHVSNVRAGGEAGFYIWLILIAAVVIGTLIAWRLGLRVESGSDDRAIWGIVCVLFLVIVPGLMSLGLIASWQSWQVPELQVVQQITKALQ